MKSLADFKRRIADGGIVTIINAGMPHKYMRVPRTAPTFTGTNILIFQPGGSRFTGLRASDWTFDGSNVGEWKDPDYPDNWIRYEVTK